MHTFIRALVAGVLLASVAGPAASQSFPTFGGIGIRAGAFSPEHASTGVGGSVEIDLGYLRWTNLRTLIGYSYFGSDVERTISGTALDGSITTHAGRVGVRLDLFRGARLSPYIGAGLSGQSVSASASDEGDQELLDGVYDGFFVGMTASGGLAFWVDTAQRLAITAEVRQAFAPKIGHTAYEIGVRFTPRGRGAYSNVREQERAAQREEAERLARESEMERTAAAAALARADSVRAAQAVRDEERLRVERAREDSIRMATDRAARDEAERQRLAREQELERQRQQAAAQLAQQQQQQQSQAEIERLRRVADSLRVATANEAAARLAAEQRAVAARATASAADSAARAAEQRAAEAERLRYAALMDLNRLISNVAEIRETERGLAIVLGQGLFASGQSSLSERARGEVGTIAAVLAQYRDNQIAVEGHTDATGSEVANQRLSELRAEAVRAALIGRGVEPSRIEMAGYGQGRPIGDNATTEGRARNRRVEIIILGARRPGGGE